MEKPIIQTHDFNEAKKQLKKFSEEIPTAVPLPTVETEGWFFGFNDHKVTGAELNDITKEIQDCFISNNDKINKVIKEFGQVYKALEALDKDYIQAIIVSIRAAEEASNQAYKAAEEAKKNSVDIKKTIKIQEITISRLSQFKEQLDDYKNLKNIDEIWNDLQLLKENLTLSNTKIISIDEDRKKHEESINILIAKIKRAYILAGSSICITLILFIFNVLEII